MIKRLLALIQKSDTKEPIEYNFSLSGELESEKIRWVQTHRLP